MDVAERKYLQINLSAPLTFSLKKACRKQAAYYLGPRRWRTSIVVGLLKPALLHAIDLSERNGRKLPLSIVTNGSIINVDIVQFILKHNVSLSVSFDILEEIQNKQRGQYRKVVANINHFAENGVDVALNTVITIDKVNRMVEMIENMGNTMPLVKKVSFKPIISSDYFPIHKSVRSITMRL